ncbi:MAG: 4Fe-4S binding protein [Bacteroidota bacterium]
MALAITDACINCGYCVTECPNDAIYEPGMHWTFSEGTSLEGEHVLTSGRVIDANQLQTPISTQYHFIVPEKCAECEGIADEPQCKSVCPDPASITVHSGFQETFDQLFRKQIQLNTKKL